MVVDNGEGRDGGTGPGRVNHRSDAVPVGIARAGWIAAQAAAGFFLLSSSAIAPALAASASPVRAHSPCSNGSASAVRVSRFTGTSTGASGSGPPIVSGSPSPSPAGTRSPSHTPSPSQSSSHSPSQSPSPSRSQSPSHSPSPSPSSSPSPSPTAGAICISARLVAHDSQTQPGGNVTYAIWVWSTVPAKRVTATANVTGHAMRAPRFTLCPDPHATVCSIGALPASQAFELLVKAHIGAKATTGEQITLTVTVQGASLSPAEAAITAVIGQASPSPSPTPSSSVPTTLPPVTFPPLPGSIVSPTNLSGLFPVVTPSPTPSPTSSPQPGRSSAGITPTASTLPLDPRLIGGQLAGLAVLAAAITMVVARLSLRTPQSSTGSTAGPSAKPAEDS